MFKKPQKQPAASEHSVSVSLLGVRIDGRGLGGVIAVPLVLLVLAMAGSSVFEGMAWFARKFPQAAPVAAGSATASRDKH